MGITATKQGELEINNPVLAVVVPENLRSNANLMRNLRRNARQLTTHFDTYATLVNIARVSVSALLPCFPYGVYVLTLGILLLMLRLRPRPRLRHRKAVIRL